ncbi:MAG: 4-(cytidine 5'-diphospho)-2-C-methyl-D-erythritol kinase [Chthoniobacterales bacterium]
MIALEAHAKVNLSLRVGVKREDGYHDIDTVMTRLQLADKIELELCLSGISLACSDASLPCGEKNLAWRAAKLFFEKAKISSGIHIKIEKKIPVEGGLAGGSSDAASVLLGMNRLYEEKFSSQELMKMASQLGSDIPFFIQNHTARCRGRGELVESLPNLQPQAEVLLIFPPFGVSTPWAFSAWDARDWQGEGRVPSAQSFGGILLENDLEAPVFDKYVVLATLKDYLLRLPGVEAALMSGSGSTVFAILRESADAEDLKQKLQAEFGETFLTELTAFLA